MQEITVIVGATSAIGRALAARLAADGASLVLAARDAEELGRVAADLRVRFQAAVTALPFEAESYETHSEFFARCVATGDLGGFVVCHGDTGVVAGYVDPLEVRRLLDVNFGSAASLLGLAAPYFETRRRGYIAAIGSVAGDRGRAVNYLYGAAKAGLAVYLQGLRQRLAKSGVAVLTVKPGYVDSAMTFGKPGVFLVATPEKAARDIARAILRRRDVIYTPGFWRWILLVMRAIPEGIFKRLSL